MEDVDRQWTSNDGERDSGGLSSPVGDVGFSVTLVSYRLGFRRMRRNE